MKSAGRRAVFNEINITPLTDIFLVLLIIMMVVAPMLDTQGLKLAVPTAGPSPDTKDTPKTLDVSIDAQDRYTVEGQPVDLPALTMRIRNLVKEKPDGVMIQVAPNASHNALTQALDAAQSAGVTKIAVNEASGSQP